MDRKVLLALRAMPEQFRFIRGMVAWIGYEQVALPYEREPRHEGVSKYPFRKMLSFAVDAITGFSIVPIRISIVMAFLFFFLAGLTSVYVFYAWVMANVVKGWASTLLIFLIFSGVQLLVLGVVGEYVGRTYMQSKNRPLFLINEICTQRSNVATPADI